MLKVFLIFTASVFFQTSAFAENSYGIFMVVKGDVKVVRGRGETQPAKVSFRVLTGDTVISGEDSRAKIVMSDKNVIYISPKTKMTIEKYSDGTSGDKNVELRLKEGRVLNNVQQKYDGEKSKFIIKTPTAVAGVRGTSFYTSFDKTTQVTEVITQSGVVTLASLTSSGATTEAVTVKKGESTTATASAPPAPPQPMSSDQIKKIESEVTGAPPPPSADTSAAPSTGGKVSDKKDDKKDSGTSSDGVKGGTTGKDGSKDSGKQKAPGRSDFRMDDKKDSSADSVKMPDAAPGTGTINPGTTSSRGGVVPVILPTPGTGLTDDTVRKKTGNTKVIIVPTTGN